VKEQEFSVVPQIHPRPHAMMLSPRQPACHSRRAFCRLSRAKKHVVRNVRARQPSMLVGRAFLPPFPLYPPYLSGFTDPPFHRSILHSNGASSGHLASVSFEVSTLGSWFSYRAGLVPQSRVLYPSYSYTVYPSLDLEAPDFCASSCSRSRS